MTAAHRFGTKMLLGMDEFSEQGAIFASKDEPALGVSGFPEAFHAFSVVRSH
jgi:hypothetical protein